MCCLTPREPGRTGPALPRGHRPDGTCRPRGQVRGWGTAGCASPPHPGTEPAGPSLAGPSHGRAGGGGSLRDPRRSIHPSPVCTQAGTRGRAPSPSRVPPRLGTGQTRLAGDDPPSRSPGRVPEDGNIASRGPAGGSIPGWPPARARKAEPSPSETHSGTVAAIADAPAGRRPHHSPAEREPHVHMGRNSACPKRLKLLIGDQP